MKRILFLSLVIIWVFWGHLHAQQQTASIEFNEESFDFGKIKEIDGPVTHIFHFTNTGTIPLIVQNVQASCGCTSPDWTRQPIMPGTKGYVKAIFDPSGRPGTFHKTLSVFSNADRSPIVLKISGEVIPKPPTVMDEYRFTMGDARLNNNYIFFGKKSPETKLDTTISIINTGKEPVKIKFMNLPDMVKAEIQPDELLPGQKGKIVMTYDVAKKNDWGFQIDYLKLSINNKAEPDYKITVSVDIREDFSKLTPAQLANAPIVKFEKVVYDFDTIKQGKKVACEFKLKNGGKTDLIFRKFETACGCTTVAPKEMTVKPGETSTVTVIFDSTGKKDKQNRSIIVVSNDPRNSRLMLKVTGVVKGQLTTNN